jgi:competence CoiA-like predicted nuclease
MIYAIDNKGNRIRATPNTIAICQCCKSKVIAKCGTVKIWHWSHEILQNCDSWYEGMSEWHYNWQNQCKNENIEVIVGNHIADIKSSSFVFELQHSSINEIEVKEREKHYGYMIWILDYKEKEKHFVYYENNFIKVKWFKPSLHFFERPVFLDMGTHLLRLKKRTEKGFYYVKVSYEEFKRDYFKYILK